MDNKEFDPFEGLDIQPEECETCKKELEAQGIEYTFDFYVDDGMAYCDHCGQPL